MKRKPKIVIKPARNGETFVGIIGGNGERIANTETYKTRSGAENSAKRLQKIVKNAVIVDKTKKHS